MSYGLSKNGWPRVFWKISILKGHNFQRWCSIPRQHKGVKKEIRQYRFNLCTRSYTQTHKHTKRHTQVYEHTHTHKSHKKNEHPFTTERGWGLNHDHRFVVNSPGVWPVKTILVFYIDQNVSKGRTIFFLIRHRRDGGYLYKTVNAMVVESNRVIRFIYTKIML